MRSQKNLQSRPDSIEYVLDNLFAGLDLEQRATFLKPNSQVAVAITTACYSLEEDVEYDATGGLGYDQQLGTDIAAARTDIDALPVKEHC